MLLDETIADKMVSKRIIPAIIVSELRQASIKKRGFIFYSSKYIKNFTMETIFPSCGALNFEEENEIGTTE